MKLLEGKKAIVTGGSRGIGRAIVERFIEQGADVAFTYVSSSEAADEIVNSYSDLNQKIKAYQSDASSYEQAEKLIKNIVEDFGGYDILVNNAGITKDNLLLRMSEEQWDRVIDVNLKSIYNMSKHALRGFLKNRSGSLIHISSVVGEFGNAGQANYAASKAGAVGFSKSLAKEVGSRGIRSNVIAPGFIKTDMTDSLDDSTKDQFMAGVPLKRYGDAQEVADAAVFLASDMSKYITGQVISVCGGLNM